MKVIKTGPVIDNPSRIQDQNTISNKVGNSIQETKKKHTELSRMQMGKIVDGMNEFINPINVSIRFELHDKLKEYYVKVVDAATNEVIREIPSKKFLDMYAAMTEYMGLFVDKKI